MNVRSARPSTKSAMPLKGVMSSRYATSSRPATRRGRLAVSCLLAAGLASCTASTTDTEFEETEKQSFDGIRQRTACESARVQQIAAATHACRTCEHQARRPGVYKDCTSICRPPSPPACTQSGLDEANAAFSQAVQNATSRHDCYRRVNTPAKAACASKCNQWKTATRDTGCTACMDSEIQKGKTACNERFGFSNGVR